MSDGRAAKASPADILAAAADTLAELSPERRQLFELRVARCWPDLREGLAAVCAGAQVGPLERRLARLAARHRNLAPLAGPPAARP